MMHTSLSKWWDPSQHLRDPKVENRNCCHTKHPVSAQSDLCLTKPLPILAHNASEICNIPNAQKDERRQTPVLILTS